VSWPKETIQSLHRLQALETTLKARFTGRDLVVDLLALAAVCQENLLVVGPPGTAKTEIIQQFTTLVDTRGFHYLLTRFTEPTELFGPLDLEQFQKGTYHIRTEGMLPEAHIAFLDEVFQGSSAILNSLLALLNERIFYNGAVRQRSPLLCMIGATNMLPEDPSLRAFADRFSLRVEVDTVPEDRVGELLEQGWDLEHGRIERAKLLAEGKEPPRELRELQLKELLALHARLLEVDLKEIRPQYAQVIRELRAQGVDISDRRAVKGLKLVAGAALLREADEAAPADFWPILHLWNRPEEADAIREVLEPKLEEVGHSLNGAAREVTEIMLELGRLDDELPAQRTSGARMAHLMALSRLRREVIVDHPRDDAARQRIEATIRQAMEQLEGADV